MKKKVNLAEQTQDEKKKIAPILFLYYELIVCPLLLNYNKVHLPSSLIAKPNLYAICDIHLKTFAETTVDQKIDG